MPAPTVFEDDKIKLTIKWKSTEEYIVVKTYKKDKRRKKEFYVVSTYLTALLKAFDLMVDYYIELSGTPI